MLLFLLCLLAYAFLMFSLTLNPVEVALWLMLIFACFALFSFFFQFEFLGILLIVLYVSALIVLFVYIILLLPPTKTFPQKIFDNLGLFFLFFFGIIVLSSNINNISTVVPWLLTKFWFSNSLSFLFASIPTQLLFLGVTVFLSHSFVFLLIGLIFFLSLFWILLILQNRV